MSLNKFIVVIFLSCLSPGLFGQVAIQQNSRDGITNLRDAVSKEYTGEFGVEYSPLLPTAGKINYSKIKGSPFWKDEMQTALLFGDIGYLGKLPVRINLATGELHFIKNGEEVILSDDVIAKIIFPRVNDSAVFVKHMPNLLLNKKPVEAFVQVLNTGKYQLLKYTKRNLASADSLFGTLKRYYFTDEFIYYIRSDEKVERIKKLNKENVLSYVPSSSSYDSWIKENDIDFKKEKDVVRFLNYYNSHLQ